MGANGRDEQRLLSTYFPCEPVGAPIEAQRRGLIDSASDLVTDMQHAARGSASLQWFVVASPLQPRCSSSYAPHVRGVSAKLERAVHYRGSCYWLR
jgi:hypothetical protein